MGHTRPPAQEITYPREGYTSPVGEGLAGHAVTDLAEWRAHGHFTQGMLKPKYAMMNKIVHFNIYPRGSDKQPREDVIQLCYEIFRKGKIDFGWFIFEVIRRYRSDAGPSAGLTFPFMITRLCTAAGVRAAQRDTMIPPPLGAITYETVTRSTAVRRLPATAPSFSSTFAPSSFSTSFAATTDGASTSTAVPTGGTTTSSTVPEFSMDYTVPRRPTLPSRAPEADISVGLSEIFRLIQGMSQDMAAERARRLAWETGVTALLTQIQESLRDRSPPPPVADSSPSESGSVYRGDGDEEDD